MNSKIILMVLFLSLLCSGRAESAKANAFDQNMEERLTELIDPVSGRIKATTLRELELALREIASFENSGFGTRSNGTLILRYKLKDLSQKEGSFGFEILARGTGKSFETYSPINIRLTFVSVSGVTYFNSLVPTPWVSDVK